MLKNCGFLTNDVVFTFKGTHITC